MKTQQSVRRLAGALTSLATVCAIRMGYEGAQTARRITDAANASRWGRARTQNKAKTLSLPPVVRLVAVGVAGAALYRWVLRPRHLCWGATAEEVATTYPGDYLVTNPEPRPGSTRAVTVDAPPSAIWPWLVQLGQDRAGFYSYAVLENTFGLDMRNGDRIVPEWQHLQAGDIVQFVPSRWLGRDTGNVPPTVAAVVDPDRSLALHTPAANSVWAFHLRPIDATHTRLIARSLSGPVSRGSPANDAIWRNVFWEVAHFIMERGMLLGIKQRAERLYQEQQATAPSRRLHVVDPLAGEAVP